MGYRSGQTEQTVNLPAIAYEGSSPSPTIRRARADDDGALEALRTVPVREDIGVNGARSSVWLERYVDIVEARGSSPLAPMPVRKGL